jgi:hypothetical protein
MTMDAFSQEKITGRLGCSQFVLEPQTHSGIASVGKQAVRGLASRYSVPLEDPSNISAKTGKSNLGASPRK